MSKARLVITAVVVEGRSQSEVARVYGVSQPWISRLVARYRAEGEAAFEPRSRRPTRSPTATSPDVVERVLRLRKELVEQGLDAGAHTLCWHLAQHHQITVSPATVWRILSRHGHVVPEPKKRPKSSYTRFEAEFPNQMWQTDFTHYRLADGHDVEILNFPGRPLPLPAGLRRLPPRHRARRGRGLSRHGRPARPTSQCPVRQRRQEVGHGLHHPLRRRPRGRTWQAEHPQRLRDRTRPLRHCAEEFLAEPSANLRKGRTLPPNAQTMASVAVTR